MAKILNEGSESPVPQVRCVARIAQDSFRRSANYWLRAWAIDGEGSALHEVTMDYEKRRNAARGVTPEWVRVKYGVSNPFCPCR